MGHKVHPVGFRLGISSDWSSRWYADNKSFSEHLEQDVRTRKYIRQRLKDASVSRVQIERPARSAAVTITPRARASSSAARVRTSSACAPRSPRCWAWSAAR